MIVIASVYNRRARNRRYAARNRARNMAATQKWREENRDVAREKTREYYAAMSDEKKAVRVAITRKWREDNREAHNAKVAASQRKRRQEDANFRLSQYLRTRLGKAMNGKVRGGSAVRDLGCSAEDFRSHIESQFQPGMTWENWGKGEGAWSLDHDYPLAKADLTDPVQFRAVANWRNYVPLWEPDNIRKSDSITDSARERFEVLANFLEVL